jgi:hypothetical protein
LETVMALSYLSHLDHVNLPLVLRFLHHRRRAPFLSRRTVGVAVSMMLHLRTWLVLGGILAIAAANTPIGM